MGAFLNEIVSGITSTVRDLRMYLLGRGLVTTVAMAAGAVSSGLFGTAAAVSLSPLLGVALVGGVALNVFMRLREMRYDQDQMANIYRDEIASQLGIAPENITRAHVHTLAYGDERRGIAPNPVLREEIDREWNKTWLKIATSSLAAMAGYAMVQFGLASGVSEALTSSLGGIGTALSVASTGIVTGLAGLFLNNGLDFAVQQSTVLGDVTLHDRIVRMNREIARGKGVTKEQVFGLFVASEKELATRVIRQFGRPYDVLPQKAKAELITSLGLDERMQAIADDLNQGSIQAGSVAFILSGQRSESVPTPRAQTQAQASEPLIPEVPQPEQEKPRFTDRINPRGNEGLSHTERENLRRAAAQLETVR